MQTTSIAGLRTGSGIIPTWGRRRSAFLLPLLLASTWLMLPPASARGQPADKQVKIFFSEIANDPNPTITSLRLRPNTPQQAYLYVRNNTAKPIKAFLEVRAGGIEGTIVPGSRIPIELKGNGLTSVVLPNPPPPPPGGKPAPPPAWRAPLLVRVLGEKNEPLGEDAEILVRRASDYVEVSKVEFDPSPKDGKENRLTVEVLAADTFSGPECHVELVLRPDRIPALLPGQKKEGTYEGSLSKPGDRLRLVAENLQFADKAKHTGQVYLTIDGYERALLYRATFEAKGSPSSPARITRSVVRLQPVAAATPSDKTRIGLEIDNVRAGETAEFGFDRDNDGAFQPTELTILPGDRRQEIILGPSGPDGAIQFKAVVSDWNPELKTTGIFGKRKLRVRVLDKDQKAIPFLDAATDDLTLQEDGYAITSTLVLDGNPPDGVKFIKAPASVVRGTAMKLTASADLPESGIKEVIFYLGKPLDRKMPPNAPKVDAKATDPKRTTWAAVFPVPADKVGNMDVTVQFTSGVGLSESATTSVLVEEPPKQGAPDKPSKASIRGVVVEGDRPQKERAVTLVDLKSGDSKGAETNKKGEFVFTDLAPGKYRLSAEKSASRTKGEEIVQVKEGEQKTGVTIKLKRQ